MTDCVMLRFFAAIACGGLFVLISGCSASGDEAITVYTARKIITMDAQNPVADAVAVRGDTIIAVGDAVALQQRYRDQGAFVDQRFADKVIMPGFVDPHIHPTIAATILPMEIVAAMAWPTEQGYSKPVRTAEAFFTRLEQLDQELESDEWLMVWGYHEPYHGPMNKTLLDQISTERPIMVWQRSVHEMFFNSKALSVLGLTEQDFLDEPQSSWQDGHIWESALFSLGQPMMLKIVSPLRYLEGLSLMSQLGPRRNHIKTQ